MAVPQGPNQRWSLDSDTLVDGRRFRILCVIDDYISAYRRGKAHHPLEFAVNDTAALSPKRNRGKWRALWRN